MAFGCPTGPGLPDSSVDWASSGRVPRGQTHSTHSLSWSPPGPAVREHEVWLVSRRGPGAGAPIGPCFACQARICSEPQSWVACKVFVLCSPCLWAEGENPKKFLLLLLPFFPHSVLDDTHLPSLSTLTRPPSAHHGAQGPRAAAKRMPDALSRGQCGVCEWCWKAGAAAGGPPPAAKLSLSMPRDRNGPDTLSPNVRHERSQSTQLSVSRKFPLLRMYTECTLSNQNYR